MIGRILIVSPHFPPVNAPDMQRVRTALPAFVAAGWEVTVLTVDDPTPTAPVEPELLDTIPAAVRVIRAHCCSRRWTRWLGVNNVAIRSLPFLFRAGHRELMARRYDAVYFSTTMFVVMPLGRIWRRLHGVPYALDLQDPWVTDFYERQGIRPPGGWKYGVVQRINRFLERWTLARASALFAVSQAYLDAAREREPRLRTRPAVELPFGTPDPDLEHVRADAARRGKLLPDGGLRLVFAGALGPGQLAAVSILFAAMAIVRQRGVRVSAHFFGTGYAERGAPVTLALAAEHGLPDCVREQPRRLPYFDALRLTLEADVNLLFGSTDLGFTPSKLFAVLAAGQPVLALAPTGSAMRTRLAAVGVRAIGISPGAESAAIAETAAWLEAPPRAAIANPAALAKFGAAAVAQRQLEVLAALS
jgi:glycosyltransferase involved in cell wall biosynthesis